MTEDEGAGEGTKNGEFHCDECGRNFKTGSGLAGHQQWHTRGSPTRAGAGVSTELIHCPVCKCETRYYRGGSHEGVTACNNCLCVFYLNSGIIYEPSPDLCMDEMKGLDCQTPAHKYWSRQVRAGPELAVR